MKNKKYLILILFIIFLALIIPFFSSKMPEGLERLAEGNKIIGKGNGNSFWIISPLIDSVLGKYDLGKFSTSIARAFGVVMCFLLAMVFFKVIGKNKIGK